jgi:hypothetical protein
MAYSRSSPTLLTVVELARARGRRRHRQSPATPSPYPEIVNPRARRLIVSGVLGVLLLIVVITALWQAWK